MRDAVIGKKLLSSLTSKELAGLALQWEVEKTLDRPQTFAYHELKATIENLTSAASYDYHAWMRLQPLMVSLQSESRIAALRATWRLSLLNEELLRPDRLELADLLQMQALIANDLRQFYGLHAALRVVGEVMGCDWMPMVEYEIGKLHGTLEIYSESITIADADLALAAYRNGDTLATDGRYFPALDLTTLYPATETVAAIRECISQKRGWDLVDLLTPAKISA